MTTNDYKQGKDLTKEPPVSPKLKLGGMVILARTIDKCRALLWGNIGEYRFDCPVDTTLFSWKHITGDAFKKFVAEGHSNDEIVQWINSQDTPNTLSEIEAWNQGRLANNMSQAPAEKRAWLEGENARLGLKKDGTLFDMLIADDMDCFPKFFKAQAAAKAAKSAKAAQ